VKPSAVVGPVVIGAGIAFGGWNILKYQFGVLYPGAGAPRACAVLTDAIANKIVGPSAHVTRDAKPNPRETQCMYQGDRGTIDIMVGDWGTIHDSSSFFGGERPVAGIGDEAYLSSMHALVARNGSRGVSIEVSVHSGEFRGAAADRETSLDEAAAKKVAPELLARLWPH